MSGNSFAFSPPVNGNYQPPLNRFIPVLPKGAALLWLKKKITPGSLILDPIGSNPYLDIEAARIGYRMLVARNNPILWLIMEVLASGCTPDDFQKNINKLLLTRRMNESLAEHIQGVYQTLCYSCGQSIQPKGYIWEKNSDAPSGKVYACPNCGDEGERPVSDKDIKNLRRLGSFQLHRNRAFQRVLQGGEYEQASIETALDCYLPRALYVVMTLINAMERMQLGKEEKRILRASLLPLLDKANSLWHWPPQDTRPLVLSLPSRFFEKNLWLSLEAGPGDWHLSNPPVPISYWPKLPPPTGGICLYNRRASNQPVFNDKTQPEALIAVFPRPNQAFWTFSALWSGWLWGRKAVNPMRSALTRRRYDWHWFTQAVHSSLQPLKAKIKPSTPFLGFLPQVSPNNFFAVLAGSRAAGFTLQGSAYRQNEELVQFEHISSDEKKEEKELKIRPLIQDFLISRSEPAEFNQILMNCISQLASGANLPLSIDDIREGLFRTIQEEVASILNDNHFAVSFDSDKKGASRYWLLDAREATQPLSERVEAFINNELADRDFHLIADIEARTCQQFPGSQTPESDLVHECIYSYSREGEHGNLERQIRVEDLPAARKKDIEELEGLISAFAHMFGFKCERSKHSIIWMDTSAKSTFQFYFSLRSPSIGLLENMDEFANVKQIVVFPASRSRLLHARMRGDPRLAGYNQGKIHLVKFRHLRWLAQQKELNLSMWLDLLDGDPPLWDAPEQLQMI